MRGLSSLALAPLCTGGVAGGRFVAGFSLLLAGFLTFAVPAGAEAPTSRLSQLMLNHATMYLPDRLALGQDNRFIFKGAPGSRVTLYISPQGQGLTLPAGLELKVGKDNEHISGVIPEKGVLVLTVPVPDTQEWEGRLLYVDAIIWTHDDYSDVKAFQMLDATGRRTSQNALVMVKPGVQGGLTVMPNMPGLPQGALQQLTQTSNLANSGDERQKQLLDDGQRNTNSILDRNSFIQRPGMTQSILQH